MAYLLDADGTIHDAATSLKVGAPAEIADQLIKVPHLAPYVMTITLPRGEQAKIRVAFSCHCFSEKFDPALHRGKQILIRDGKWKRVFDQRRYDLSLYLPTLIGGLPGKSVYMQPRRDRGDHNYLSAETLIDLDDGETYQVFFVLRKKRGREGKVRYQVELFVESAYPTTRPIQGMKVKFLTLVGNTLAGKEIPYNPQ